jgi:hypothetical protein
MLVSLIDQALAKEPDSIAYLDSRAWVYYRQGLFTTRCWCDG